MRKEATLEQWKNLYETATRIKQVAPWQDFWDMDLIAVKRGEEKDTVFYSILGKSGHCYGITVYEGYEGLNTFMMLTLQEEMNISAQYAMLQQKNLTCYWGNREELTEKQRKVIKDLGYKYRGKNQWLYFLSFEPGYSPYNLDQTEVIRMTSYLQDLELALKYYSESKLEIDFQNGNMALLSFEKDKNTWDFKEAAIPLTSFQYGNLIITNEELLTELQKLPKQNTVLEADICATSSSVADKKYDRPAAPALSILCEAVSGIALACEISFPGEDAIEKLVSAVIDFSFQYGTPKEIRVSNVIVEAGLEHFCKVCGTKLRRVKSLPAIKEMRNEMSKFI